MSMPPAVLPTRASTDPPPGSASEVAKDEAREVSQQAMESGRHVADVAKDKAGQVANEAGAQARSLTHQAREELSSQAAEQQQRLASGLRSLGDQLHAMSQSGEQQGVASDLAQQVSERSHQAASWLAAREPGSLLDEARSFASRRPGMFLAIALGAGIIGGRLTRGAATFSDSADSTPSARSESKPTTAAVGTGRLPMQSPGLADPAIGTPVAPLPPTAAVADPLGRSTP